MQNVQSNLFTRSDTFFGVCEGYGEDLGIHPNILRLALTPFVFFYPLPTVAAYLAAGLVLLAIRLAFPNPRAASPAPLEAPGTIEAAAAPATTADAPTCEAEAVPLAA